MDFLTEEEPNLIFLDDIFIKDAINELFSEEIPDKIKEVSEEILSIDFKEFDEESFHDDFKEEYGTDLEDVLEREGLLNMVHDKSTELIEYTPLPIYFTDIKTWVKSTSLHCWYCDCSFGGIPCFISEGITKNFVSETKEKEQHKVYGNFCTFNCAKAYLERVKDIRLQNEDPTKLLLLRDLLNLLYYEFYGREVTAIIPSPPKTCMLQYGGNKTAFEYRKIISKLDKKYEESVKNSLIGSVVVT